MKCLNELVRASKGAITKKEAKEILQAVEKRFNRPMPKKDVPLAERSLGRVPPEKMTIEERMLEAANEAFQERIEEKQNAVRATQKDITTQAAARESVALYGHGHTGVREYLREVEGRTKTIERELVIEVYQGIKDVMEEHGGKITREAKLDILRKVWDPELGRKQYLNTSEMTPVERLAYYYRLASNKAHAAKNEAGAAIKFLAGRYPQSWDTLSVKWFGLNAKDKLRFNPWAKSQALITRAREKAKLAWVDFILPRLDRERYLDEETGLQLTDDQMREVLEEVWLTIADHGLKKVGEGGEPSLAERLGAHRELHFKGPEAFLEANEAFGKHDILDGMVEQLRRDASEIALLERFGTHIERGFKSLERYAGGWQSEKTAHGSTGMVRNQHFFDELTGASNHVREDRYQMVAHFMQGWRNLITASKLGSLVFSMIPDLATLNAMARFNADSNGEMWQIMFKMLDPRSKADRQIAEMHGFLHQSMVNDLNAKFATDGSSRPGWTDKAAHFVLKWQGAKWWNDRMKMVAQMHTGFFLAKYRGVEYGALDPVFRRTLDRYHITADDWNLIRTADTVKIKGMEFITPYTLFKVQHPGEMSGPAKNAAELRQQARDAAIKAVDLMIAEADVAVLTPGAYEMSIAKGGTHPGEGSGEFLRSFWLFRTFAIAMKTKVWPRVFEEGPGRNQLAFRAQLAIGLAISGAVGVQLNEIARGRNPRDMTEPEFWGAAMLKSGGLGFAGDLLSMNYNSPLESIGKFIGGPVASMTTDALKLTVGNVKQGIEGKETRTAAEAIQFAKNNAPLMNLWYTRLALDHLLFYHVQEAANPGYLRRLRARTEKENNQTFWWAPDDDTPQGPPDVAEMFRIGE